MAERSEETYDDLDRELSGELKVEEPEAAEAETAGEFDYGSTKWTEIFAETKSRKKIWDKIKGLREEVAKFKDIAKILGAGSATLLKKEQELADLESAYKEVDAEYRADQIEKKLAELAHTVQKETIERKGMFGLPKYLTDIYRRLGEYNLGNYVFEKQGIDSKSLEWKKDWGKKLAYMGLRTFSSRAVITTALLGGGFAAGAVGATATAGWILGARMGVAGMGSYMGAYGGLRGAREFLGSKFGSKEIEVKSKEDLDKVLAVKEEGDEIVRKTARLDALQAYLAKLVFKQTLKGTNEAIFKNESFKIAAEEYGNLVREIAGIKPDADPAELGNWNSEILANNLKKLQRNEKWLDRGTKAVSFAAASLWVGRIYAKGIEHIEAVRAQPGTAVPLEDAPIRSPAEPAPKGPAVTEPFAPKVSSEASKVEPTGAPKEVEGQPMTETPSTPSSSPPTEAGGERGTEVAEASKAPITETQPATSPKTPYLTSPTRGEEIKEATSPRPILHHEQDTGATIEVEADGSAVINAGRRGIEGALLDLREKDPEKYGKMIQRLYDNYESKSTDPLANEDHRLIHRFILKYAEDHHVDSEKLNHILEGKLKINADGSLAMEEGDVKFMPVTTPSQSPPIQGTGGEINLSPSSSPAGGEGVETSHLASPTRLPAHEGAQVAGDNSPLPNPPHQGEGIGGEGREHFRFSAEPQAPTAEQSIQEAISASKQPLNWNWQTLQEDIRARDAIQNPETDADTAQASGVISTETPAQLSEDLQRSVAHTAAADSLLPEPPRPDRAIGILDEGREQAPNDHEQINEEVVRRGRVESFQAAAEQNYNTSEALKLVLGEGKYETFLQAEFGLAPVEVDGVQEFTIANFVKQFEAGGPEFKIHYGKLMDFLRENLLESPSHDNKTIRDVVCARAAIWRAE